MITNEQIERINQLAKKAKTPEGLTEAEKAEQKTLRDEYIASFRANLKSQLDQIEIVEGVEESEGKKKDEYIIGIEEELS
ncbi:uncharacterized protein YnzC (UPF0291/DUF896 family) [Clostridiales Family XIII bacterium PM5-7]